MRYPTDKDRDLSVNSKLVAWQIPILQSLLIFLPVMAAFGNTFSGFPSRLIELSHVPARCTFQEIPRIRYEFRVFSEPCS